MIACMLVAMSFVASFEHTLMFFPYFSWISFVSRRGEDKNASYLGTERGSYLSLFTHSP